MRFLSRAVSVEKGGNLRKLTMLRFIGATFVIGAVIVGAILAHGAGLVAHRATTILGSLGLAGGFFAAGILTGRFSKRTDRLTEELASKDRELARVKLDADCIITNVSSGLIVTNIAGEIITCNPAAAKILGLQPGVEVKGKLFKDVMPHMSSLDQELERALATDTPRRRHQIEIRSRDGVALPVGISLSILKSENGDTRGVVAIFQDLTEVHHMREKVRRADKMAAIGELSSAIAHEIRAPLASICGSIEMLSGELALSGDNQKLMELIIKESDRLDRIITDFLEFARLKPPAFEPIDVARCIDEVLLLFAHSSDLNRNVSFEVLCDTANARIFADDEQMRQVFLNLILNACEAMREGGRFTIRIGSDVRPLHDGGNPEECVVVNFENTGPAIPENVLPHIFEPFYSTKDGGTGLGLAIVARIVEAHLGHVRVTSDENRGTRFSIVLPSYSGVDERRTEILAEEFISF